MEPHKPKSDLLRPATGIEIGSLLAALEKCSVEDERKEGTEKEARTPQPPPSSPVPTTEGEASTSTSEEAETGTDDGTLPDFPLHSAQKLKDMLARSKWVVPVLPKQELEVLIDASIAYAKQGKVGETPEVVEFIEDGLLISMDRLMNDQAVLEWKNDIQRLILNLSLKVAELAALLMEEKNEAMLRILSFLFNHLSRFHSHNGGRPSPVVHSGEERRVFSRPGLDFSPKAWLQELIDRFGAAGGFSALRTALATPLSLIHTLLLIRPFVTCRDYLDPSTTLEFLAEPLEMCMRTLESVTDEELKKETSPKERRELAPVVLATELGSQIHALTIWTEEPARIVAAQEARLSHLLRVVKLGTFSGRMGALRDLNTALTTSDVGMTHHELAAWMVLNQIVPLALKANLHQPQYVDKVETLFRSLASAGAMDVAEVGELWAAQAGKHDVIQANLQRLIARTAAVLPPPPLHALFATIENELVDNTHKERERLLQLIRMLAEEDSQGKMTDMALWLVWHTARKREISNELVNLALEVHLRILETSYNMGAGEKLLVGWISRCEEVIEKESEQFWVVPAIRHVQEHGETTNSARRIITHKTPGAVFIKKIAMLAPEPESTYGRGLCRSKLVSQVQSTFDLVARTATNLADYQDRLRNRADVVSVVGTEDPGCWSPVEGSRAGSHVEELSERLQFIQFLLKEGSFWLCEQQAKEIWLSLIVRSVFEDVERRLGFGFFASLLCGPEEDLDPEIMLPFFENYVLRLDPALLDGPAGFECFERFFLLVNQGDHRIILPHNGPPSVCSQVLHGEDYLWRIILDASPDVSEGGISLFKRIYCNPAEELLANRANIHAVIADHSFSKLRVHYDTLGYLGGQSDHRETVDEETRSRAEKMVRVLSTLQAYIEACDQQLQGERTRMPLGQSSLGRALELTVAGGRDPVLVPVHANLTLRRLKAILNAHAGLPQHYVVTRSDGEEVVDASEENSTLEALGITRDPHLILRPITLDRNLVSSMDSSGDEAELSPSQLEDAALTLPGEEISGDLERVEAILAIADLADSLPFPSLNRAALRLLSIVPGCNRMEEELTRICCDPAESAEDRRLKLVGLLLDDSTNTAFYWLQLVQSVVLPVIPSPLHDQLAAGLWQVGGVGLWLELLSREDYLPGAEVDTRLQARRILLRLALFFLHIACQLDVRRSPKGPRRYFAEGILALVPNTVSTHFRNAAQRTVVAVLKAFPNTGPLGVEEAEVAGIFRTAVDALRTPGESEECSEEVELSLECLSLSMALCPDALARLCLRDCADWNAFILHSLTETPLGTRGRAAGFLEVLAERAADSGLDSIGELPHSLLSVLLPSVPDRLAGPHASVVLHLLCRLVEMVRGSGRQLPEAESWLSSQLQWLESARKESEEREESFGDEAVLEGRLRIAAALVQFLSDQQRSFLGPASGINRFLLKELVEEFLFPASLRLSEWRAGEEARRGEEAGIGRSVTHVALSSPPPDPIPRSETWAGRRQHRLTPVCPGQESRTAAFILVLQLTRGHRENLHWLVSTLSHLFYADKELGLTGSALLDWDMSPSGELRGSSPFVGLKNAGATCYINSVLQQLFMIEPLRETILNTENPVLALDEDTDDQWRIGAKPAVETKESEEDYPLRLLGTLQLAFAHLSGSVEAWYSPRGLWKAFRFSAGSGPIRVREQQDALEFLGSLLDYLEKAFQKLGLPIPTAPFQGAFADQKICKSCPHRYEREEAFETLAVDVRNRSSLLESLSEYVKGDLLEGDNAYFCQQCDANVDAVKRLCIKKLPHLLAIQLKRFDFDYERVIPVKFNDYFHFPMLLDMEPYTAAGLARRESGDESESVPEKFELRGVVVHSGVQASSGHYYSYIRVKRGSEERWFKFDDTDVSEVELSEEEMRSQWFGGDAAEGERGRLGGRRGKRWWNAYILLYQRRSRHSPPDLANLRKMLPSLEAAVAEKNMKLMHERSVMSEEFGSFVRLLAERNLALILSPSSTLSPEDACGLAGESLRLGSLYLLGTGLRTSGGEAHGGEWSKLLLRLLQASGPVGRLWFAQWVLFRSQGRILQAFLLDCPTLQVREFWATLLVDAIRVSREDVVPQSVRAHLLPRGDGDQAATTLGRLILEFVMVAVAEGGGSGSRYMGQALALFHKLTLSPILEAAGWSAEVELMWRCGCVEWLASVVLEELPLRAEMRELEGAFAALARLLRSARVPAHRLCSNPKWNPFAACEEPPGELSGELETFIYEDDRLMRKYVEYTAGEEETRLLLQYLAWENITFSNFLLTAIIPITLGVTYSRDFRALREVMEAQMRLQDSLHSQRLIFLFKGSSRGEDEIFRDWDGILQVIQREREGSGRKCAALMEVLVGLLERDVMARELVDASPELRRLWASAVQWLVTRLTRTQCFVTLYAKREIEASGSGYYSSYEHSPTESEIRASAELIRRAEALVAVEREPPALSTVSDAPAVMGPVGLGPVELDAVGLGAVGSESPPHPVDPQPSWIPSDSTPALPPPDQPPPPYPGRLL